MRTEEEVLKDFEELGFDIIYTRQYAIELNNDNCTIRISKYSKWYRCYDKYNKLALPVTMQEHKLLTELFQIWNWL